jgi:hypothetical protein
MYGDDPHMLGLRNAARCIGSLLSSQRIREKLKAGDPERLNKNGREERRLTRREQ